MRTLSQRLFCGARSSRINAFTRTFLSHLISIQIVVQILSQDDAQDAEIFLWRVYFEKTLAISSFPAVSHIKFLIADNLTHPTRNKSSSLSITDRPSTKQMCENLCCNYLQKSCQQLLPPENFFNHTGIFYIYCLICQESKVLSSSISNQTICNNLFGALSLKPIFFPITLKS